MRYVAAALVLVVVLPLAGCARGGDNGTTVPDLLVRFRVTMAAAIDDTSYYFVAIDADGDYGLDGPLPVAAGPNWGNGWGTGSMTHYILYHQGRYDVYEATRTIELESTSGGITAASGSPEESDTGTFALTVGTVTLGAATVAGTGPITAVANTSDQNAGVFSIETDAAGETVAGGTSFTPATDGGRVPTTAERAALDALNAGGVAVATDSLSAFGITLTVGAAAAGTQTITVGATSADVEYDFEPNSGSNDSQGTGTVTANSTTPTATPPIAGVDLTTATLATGQTAKLRSEFSPTGASIGTPYESNPPYGGTQLDVTLDLAQLGGSVGDLSVNFITTTELIYDAIITDPDLNTYDGLGVQGNTYATFDTTQTRTILNSDSFTPEGAGDPTLDGLATSTEQDAVDIVDWNITVQRLG